MAIDRLARQMPASMGPRSIDRGGGAGRRRRREDSTLQWGRDQLIAEGVLLVPGRWTRESFNGAAIN